MKHIEIIVILLLILFSCQEKESKDVVKTNRGKTYIIPKINENKFRNEDLTSEDYVNRAGKLQIEVGSPISLSDTLKLKKALKYLNKAIELKKDNSSAYANKVEILKLLGRYKEALQVLSIAVKNINNFAEGYAYQGFIYEKFDNMDSAIICYHKAIEEYSKRIKDENRIEDKIHKAFILSLIDKNKGYQEIEDLVKNNPKHPNILFWKHQLFDDFNRKEFINKQ